MKPALLDEEAECEFKAAVAYYEGKSRGLGLDLEVRVRTAVGEIEERPEGFPYHQVPPIRKCHIKRFPFTIFDFVLPDVIWVIAIAHNRQRPDYWRRRLQ